jgi:hypothetical protein
MTATINQCLAQLQSDLQTALVSSQADKVYGYRTLPNKLNKSVYLTYVGGASTRLVTGSGGIDPYYDFAAVIVVKHDGSESSLEAAEQAANTIENTIVNTLHETRNSYWYFVEFFRPSIRPGAPPELPSTRYGEVYIRLKVR